MCMMDIIDRTIIDWLDDISKINIIYTCLLVATANSLTFFDPIEFYSTFRMGLNSTLANFVLGSTELMGSFGAAAETGLCEEQRPSLFIRMSKRLVIYLENSVAYIQNQFSQHSTASIVSFSVLIILLSIIGCFFISWMREEEKRIKEYKKLRAGSSQSFIAIGQNPTSGTKVNDCFNELTRVYQKSGFNQFHSGGYQQIVERQANDSSCNNNNNNNNKDDGNHFVNPMRAPTGSSDTANTASLTGTMTSSSTHLLHNHQRDQQMIQQQSCRSDRQVRLHEMRRETYFGLVRLSKPGCRTIVLLCDAQSRAKLLSKFYHCVYPYRKNKSLQFAYLLIERNIGWYKDLLKSAMGEKRYFRINPINCIGTVLVLNGFKKYFSVYHASHARWNPPDDPPFLLLEEALLDNLPEWLERVFAGKVNRYYVESWPNRVQYTY